MRHTNLDIATLGQDAAFREFWEGEPQEMPEVGIDLDADMQARFRAGYEFRLEQLRIVAPSRLADEDRGK